MQIRHVSLRQTDVSQLVLLQLEGKNITEMLNMADPGMNVSG